MKQTKEVFRSGPYADLIAQGVKVGSMLYLFSATEVPVISASYPPR